MIRTHQQGFTLIELMITVAIVGILGAIAYPAYTSSVLKGKRAQGRAAVAELMQQQERYMTQNNTYLVFSSSGSGSSITTSPSTAATTFKVFSGDNSATAAYILSAAQCGTVALTDCIQVTATPINADAEVDTLSMTSTGIKSCTGTAASTNFAMCWP